MSILPNIITTGNLLCGISAIWLAVTGRALPAVYLIFLGMTLDYFDGRIARLTNSASRLGMYLDSIADVITFGVAPVVLVFALSPRSNRMLIFVLLVIYAASGVYRIIRYIRNAHIKTDGLFTGMPIPAAAGIMMSYMLVYLHTDSAFPYFITGILLVISSVLMVSRVPYFHFARVITILPRPAKILSYVLILLFLLSGHGFAVLFVLFTCYTIFAIQRPAR